MKTVYDDDTQKLIDLYENRKAEIHMELMEKLNTATGQAEYYGMLDRFPRYNPLHDNMEYQALNNKLFNIYTLAVPKYLVSKEDYERIGGTTS